MTALSTGVAYDFSHHWAGVHKRRGKKINKRVDTSAVLTLSQRIETYRHIIAQTAKSKWIQNTHLLVGTIRLFSPCFGRSIIFCAKHWFWLVFRWLRWSSKPYEQTPSSKMPSQASERSQTEKNQFYRLCVYVISTNYLGFTLIAKDFWRVCSVNTVQTNHSNKMHRTQRFFTWKSLSAAREFPKIESLPMLLVCVVTNIFPLANLPRTNISYVERLDRLEWVSESELWNDLQKLKSRGKHTVTCNREQFKFKNREKRPARRFVG